MERVPDFPVDIVYTWVNPSEPAWQKKHCDARSGSPDSDGLCRDGATPRNTRQSENLKYSLRSVFTNCRFFRKIFIVTDEQTPPFVNPSHPLIQMVSHREIFKGTGALPTFNSHAIESRLHHIPGLSEHFIYFNDDFFLGKPVTKDLFFPSRDVSVYFPSPVSIDPEPVSTDDLAISAAAKNGRELMEKRYGANITNHILHAPYPLRRSVLFEMEQTFPEIFTATANHRFRHVSDHSIAAFLYFHYAGQTNRARPGHISSMYLDNGFRHVFRKIFFTLFLKRYQTFCINGGSDSGLGADLKQRSMNGFLRVCFPRPCAYERQVGL